MNLEQLRKAYHEAICQQVLGYRAGVLNIADEDIGEKHWASPGHLDSDGILTLPGASNEAKGRCIV